MKATRRGFLKTAAAGVFWIPVSRLYGQDVPALPKQVRVAIVGAGGIGYGTTNLLKQGGATVVALCDTDGRVDGLLARNLRETPGVPLFRDYREMIAKMGREFDAVAINTPDHTHACIAIDCMKRGYHVYVQKPLSPSFEECALVRKVQHETGRVFQLGNQRHPGCRAYEFLRDQGAFGEIVGLESWTGRSPRRERLEAAYGSGCPSERPKPQAFDASYDARHWDVWLGPAADYGYSTMYAPGQWRVWWGYGSSSIGDFGFHNMDPAMTAFELGMPYSVTAHCSPAAGVCHADGTRIELKFRPNRWVPKGMTLTWRDGKDTAPYPVEGLDPEVKYPRHGMLIRGTKCTMLGDSHAALPTVVAETGKAWGASAKGLKAAWDEKVKGFAVPMKTHYGQFVKAVLAGDPKLCDSNADYAEPYGKTLDLCLVATRYPEEEILFDEKTQRITNKPEANAWFAAPARGDWDARKLAGV